MHRVYQGAVPDVAYTDPGHGKEMIVELKSITAGPTRYDRDVATSLRAAVNKREQQLYQEFIPDPAPFERQKVFPHTGRHSRPLEARPHNSHQLRGELRGMGSRVLR